MALLVANFIPKSIPAVILISALFQNLFVSMTSPLIQSLETFNFVRGFNFLTLVIFFLFYWFGVLFQRQRYNALFMRYFYASTIVLLVVGVYFAFGLIKNGQGAIIYLRNIAVPLMVFQVTMTIAYSHRPKVTVPFIVVAVLIVLLGYFEFFFRDEWLQLTNYSNYAYWNTTAFREVGYYYRVAAIHRQVMTGLTDQFRVTLFNTPLLADLDLSVLRLNGPNIHSISYAYALCFLSLFSFANRRFGLFMLIFPILVFTSAKGALVVVAVTVFMALLNGLFEGRFALVLFGLLMIAYCTFVIISGIKVRDYHVLGLIGGLKGFLSNPIGRGLGAGGNLAVDFGKLDWEAAQNEGETETAVESAIGVILFQMGIAAFVVIGFYGWVGFTVWRMFVKLRHPQYCIAAYGLFAILVNGLFQEEALFSPLSLGLMISFAGLAIGSAARTGALEVVLRPSDHRALSPPVRSSGRDVAGYLSPA
ncbi:hypothetical protein [Hartmannibacter diazotrophicus]|uniref:hypothetical protein n=1 Tax=Hartmannibacter diazotrophicus TaxID=1482074 RepID=UPI0012FD9FA6|nr:hypothetical protein [Hartmannibacter diazotrophicus]